tara:strand:+ start:401 stop:1003 length:603 start_codon:yes stop_codon:yes gene_type:complete
MIEKLKFKKLLSEYKSLEYEYQMVKEILKDAHLDFEVFYRQWCALRDIDIDQLNESNHEKVTQIFEKNETGIVKTGEPKKKSQKHKEIYKAIAKKIHPDKLNTADSNYWRDYMDFKDTVSSIAEENWGKLFEIADRHNIYLKDYETICADIEQDIERLRGEIDNEKQSYSWKLYECKNDECKDRLIKSFLSQLFGWKDAS